MCLFPLVVVERRAFDNLVLVSLDFHNISNTVAFRVHNCLVYAVAALRVDLLNINEISFRRLSWELM